MTPTQTPRKLRVIEPDRSKTSAHQEAILTRLLEKRGRLLTPYKIWIHAPGVAEGMEALGTHLNKKSTVSDAERELVILMTAVHWGSPFVTAAHARHGRSAGLPDALVEAVLAKQHPQPEDARLQAVALMTGRALTTGGVFEDAEYDGIVAALGRDGVAEIIALIGYYTATAMAMRIHEVWPKAE